MAICAYTAVIYIVIMFTLHVSQCVKLDYICKPMRWQLPSRDVIHLVSFPGSGNTWLRYLLQIATGIYTGSIYYDMILAKNGFPGEGVSDGTVLVAKTHNLCNNDYTYLAELDLEFNQSAILLIRNPRDAILSSYNFYFAGGSYTGNFHTDTATKDTYKLKEFSYRKSVNDEGTEPVVMRVTTMWERFVFDGIEQWKKIYLSWLNSFPGRIHVVRYEKLVNNTRSVLRGILKFVKYNISEAHLNCVMENREGLWRRLKKLKKFDPFTEVMYSKFDAIELAVSEATEIRNNRTYQRMYEKKTSKMTGVPSTTIRRMIAEGRPNGSVFSAPGKKKRGGKKNNLDSFDLEIA